MSDRLIDFGKIRPLPDASLHKSFALKPLEEVAEVYSAWENYTECGDLDLDRAHHLLDCLSYEIGDVVQTMANLAKAVVDERERLNALGSDDGCRKLGVVDVCGWDSVMEAIFESNLAKGRYDAGESQG